MLGINVSLDPERQVLSGAAGTVQLRHKSFNLLIYLVRNKGWVVSKDELLQAVWGDAAVGDDSLAQCISELRAALGDTDRTAITTVPRRGYILNIDIPLSSQLEVAVHCSPSGDLAEEPQYPSVAVLPFINFGGDRDLEYLCDGLTDDLIIALARFSELVVISRNSTFTYKGRYDDARRVGRELDARYLLQGSLRRAGAQIRVNCWLVDADTGSILWAERLQQETHDIAQIQDEIARAVVTTVAPYLTAAAAEQSLRKPRADWKAQDFFWRASASYRRFWSTTSIRELDETRSFLAAAVELEPNYARAVAMLSATFVTSYLVPLNSEYLSQPIIERALALARKAVQLDPMLPEGRANLGTVLTFLCRFDEAVAEHKLARALNPNFADWRFTIALVRAGMHYEAIQYLEKHKRLDPFFGAPALAWLGLAHYLRREYVEAAAVLRESVTRAPKLRHAHAWLAVSYARLGSKVEAQMHAAEVLRIDPRYRTNRQPPLPFKFAEDATHLFDGLDLAGLP